MNEKIDLLNWLYENGFLVLGMQTIETIADLFTVDELRELVQQFAAL